MSCVVVAHAFQDRGGIWLQQQVNAIQLQLHGAACGQEHMEVYA